MKISDYIQDLYRQREGQEACDFKFEIDLN